MSDKPDRPPSSVSFKATGKTFRGQDFVPVLTSDDVIEAKAAQAPFEKEGAVSIEVYFAMRGHRDPVRQAAMRAFTTIQRATPPDWDNIFSGF